MKSTKRLAVALAVATLAWSMGAQAVDAYDPSTQLLTLESVTVGAQTYKNVAVTLSGYSQLNIGGGNPVADTFDPATNLLTMGTVFVGGTAYTNVQVRVDSYTLLSAAGPATADTQVSSSYTGVSAAYLSSLNAYRTQCGLPALTQNTRLDATAAVYGTLGGRAQAAATASNYALPSTVGFVGSDYLSTSSDAGAIGRSQALVALMEPYAMLTLMRPYSEVGISTTTGTKNGMADHKANLAMGNPQTRGIPSPLTFPCANTTDIPTGVAPTTAGAVSNIGTPAAATATTGWQTSLGGRATGTPIAVFAQPGDNLVIWSATISAGGASVPFIQWDSTRAVGVTTGQFYPASWNSLYSYEGLVLPLVPLAANTTYDVAISGTVNGVLFNKAFRFKTGVSVQ